MKQFITDKLILPLLHHSSFGGEHTTPSYVPWMLVSQSSAWHAIVTGAPNWYIIWSYLPHLHMIIVANSKWQLSFQNLSDIYLNIWHIVALTDSNIFYSDMILYSFSPRSFQSKLPKREITTVKIHQCIASKRLNINTLYDTHRSHQWGSQISVVWTDQTYNKDMMYRTISVYCCTIFANIFSCQMVDSSSAK